MTTTQRTAITEVTGHTGGVPAAPTPEQLAAMSLDERREAANAWWLATMPPAGPAPTTQPTRTIADLLDG